MRAVTFVCRGIFLCDWKSQINDDEGDNAYKRHDLDHYLHKDHYLAARDRTNTVKMSKINTVQSFTFLQTELRTKLAEKWVEFDETLGMYRPILDYAAMKRLKFLERTG